MATLPIETYDPKGISSGFGLRRHPITGKMGYHYGIDYPAPVGTPVLAYRAGQVVVSKMQTGGGGLGEYITIAHGDGTYSLYAHLSLRCKKQFDIVQEGEQIGLVGSTGDSTGPHLHFGICSRYIAANVNKSAWKNPKPILADILKQGESTMRTLRQGMRGADVKYMQYLLRCALESMGEPCDDLVADGSFGGITKKHVGRFQVLKGMVDKKGNPDYIVGPKTRAALGLADFHVHVFDKGERVWFAGMPFDDFKANEKLPAGKRERVRFTLREWAGKEDASMIWNLALFNTDTGETVNYLKAKDKEVGYSGVDDRVEIDWRNKVGGYKVGIRDAKRIAGAITGKRGRTAVGTLQDGRFFVVQSTTTATEYALVSFMLANFRVKILLFEDGGGSTGFYDARRGVLIAPEQEGQDGRPVASVICWKGAAK